MFKGGRLRTVFWVYGIRKKLKRSRAYPPLFCGEVAHHAAALHKRLASTLGLWVNSELPLVLLRGLLPARAAVCSACLVKVTNVFAAHGA